MTNHSGDAANMQEGFADAGKPITREEREDLRRLHKAFNEGVFGSSKAMAMTVVYTGACNRALPRLLDTIDALETRIEIAEEMLGDDDAPSDRARMIGALTALASRHPLTPKQIEVGQRIWATRSAPEGGE